MNIGIDFDDTITEHHSLFNKLTNSLKRDNTIYIISSCDRMSKQRSEKIYEEKRRKLNEWKIHYKKLFLAFEPIPINKAKLCKKYKIDIMIDNDRKNLNAIRKYCKTTVGMEFVFKSNM